MSEGGLTAPKPEHESVVGHVDIMAGCHRETLKIKAVSWLVFWQWIVDETLTRFRVQ